MVANFENRTLYHGDNLDFLRGMNSDTVHLIATDPPFNKGRDFHATPDSLAAGARFQDRWSWDRDVHEDWVDSIKDDWPAVHAVIESSKVAYGDDIAAFLCFMGVRLIEMRRVLRADGSLYLHCDQTASHYLKVLLDAVFGRRNFRNEIVWRSTSAHSDSKRFGANTEAILFYTKGDKWTWNQLYEPYDDKYKARYRFKDPDGRVYTDDNLTAKGLSGGGYEYEYKGAKSLWRVPLETMKKLDAGGRLHFTSRGGIRRKRYLDEMSGRAIQQLWADIDPINSQAHERTGYPTQKPLKLYERIIEASSNEGDFVLDPFCGCATTPIAAERLGRQWVGIDIWDSAYRTVLDRLESEGLATPNPEEDEDEVVERLLTFGAVHYFNTPPERTDEGEVAAPVLRLRLQRPTEPWQRLSHREIVNILYEAQRTAGSLGAPNMVICGGCGRVLESEFMELDHIQPRAEGGANDITNRILLCRPCNGRKSADLTLRGLMRENRRQRWMQDDGRARLAQDSARIRAEEVRDTYVGC